MEQEWSALSRHIVEIGCFAPDTVPIVSLDPGEIHFVLLHLPPFVPWMLVAWRCVMNDLAVTPIVTG